MTVSLPSLRKLELAASVLERGEADADFQRMTARAIRRAVREARETELPGGLTERQLAALTFIDGYIRTRAIAPTFAEVCEALGLKSKSGVHRLLQGLQERGWIEQMPGRARAMRVLVSPPQAKPAGEADAAA